MKNSTYRCFPICEEHDLLVRAALFPKETALTYWLAYCEQVDLRESHDHSAYELLPVIFRNLECVASSNSSISNLYLCKSVYRHTWLRNQLLLKEFKSLVNILKANAIHPCLLKGMALIDSYYGDLGMRVLGDIDLLISPEQVMKTINLLLLNGYKLQHQVDLLTQKNILYRRNALELNGNHQTKIDLHWRLYSENIVQFSDDIADNLRESFYDKKITVMNSEFQLLHTLTHAMQYSHMPSFKWIVDAVKIIQHEKKFNWDVFLYYSEKYRFNLPIKLTMNYLIDNRYITLPSIILSKINRLSYSNYDKAYLRLLNCPGDNVFWAIRFLWHRNLREANYRASLSGFVLFLVEFWKLKLWTLPFFLFYKFFKLIAPACEDELNR